MEAANNLASTIRIGSLSLELEEISSKVVSAKLGNDAGIYGAAKLAL